MKPFKIGTYQFGYTWAELWAHPDSENGTWTSFKDRGGICHITVGMSHSHRWEAYGVLMHEVLEGLMCQLRLRYVHSNSFSNASDSFIFHFDHNQFTELADRAGSFFNESKKDFDAAWETVQNAKKKKKKKKK